VSGLLRRLSAHKQLQLGKYFNLIVIDFLVQVPYDNP
jgi:hypothetical protein